jgi:hypothetical protein
MGHGVAYAWTKEDAAGNPVAVGVTFTESALSGLPTEKPNTGFDGYEFPLALPKNGATAKTPFDHVALEWMPKGHIPPGIYDVPHFDVHFYMTPVSERLKITLDADDMVRCRKQPDAKLMPEGYIYAPDSEIKFMGAHWVDLATPELNGKPFTYTFLFGSYNGNVMFYEPMVTMEYLKRKPNLVEAIKQPREVQHPGLYYPTKYTIRYDETRHEYTVTLEGFEKR